MTRERRCADWYLVPAEQVRAALLESGCDPSRVILLPYGVDTDRFRPEHADRESAPALRLLFVGGNSERKGLPLLLEALEGLEFPVELSVVGASDATGRRLRAGAPNSVIWHGNVPKLEVHRYFEQADVFVLPTKGEGSALAVLEAMSAGLPVVTTQHAGAVITDGLDGMLVPVDDARSLVHALRAMTSSELRARLGVAARQTVQADYSWKAYRARILDFYHGIGVC
jgi:glycosyltransferase involved in cell wall biosynthesis